MSGPLYTQHLTSDEKERLYWQAGLTELAAIFAIGSDCEAAVAEQAEELETMVPDVEYKQLEVQADALHARLSAAQSAVDALYLTVETAKRLDRAAILAALVALELEADL